MGHGVIIKDFQTGEETVLSSDEWAKCKHKISSHNNAAYLLQKVINDLDDISNKLYDLSLYDAIDIRLGGRLESYACIINSISTEMQTLID